MNNSNQIYQEQIGSNIARMRKCAGFKQHQIAEILNVSLKTISNWEHGKGVDITLLIELSKLFDCKIIDFFMGINIS